MEDIAAQQQVKINTIEDHVLEILIKGYMSNYDDFTVQLEITTRSEFLSTASWRTIKILQSTIYVIIFSIKRC